MNELYAVAFKAGFHDSFSPFVFMVSAIFILQFYWLKEIKLFDRICSSILLVVVYLLGFYYFNFGLGQGVVLNKLYFGITKIVVFLLSSLCVFLAVINLIKWFNIDRTSAKEIDIGIRPIFKKTELVIVLVVLITVLISSFSVYWPIDKYIFLLTGEGNIKGHWSDVWSLLMIYLWARIWPLILLICVYHCLKMRNSIVVLIQTLVLLAASSAVVLIVK